MRLLILGAGGIGGYFGGRLVEKGVGVTFLVRPAQAAQLVRDGLVIRSPLGDSKCRPRTIICAEGEPYDTIILACKAYELDSAIDAIGPVVGPSTFILPLLDGLRHLDILDCRFGAQRVLGGLAHISVTRGDRGPIVHLDHHAHLALGPRSPEQESTARELHGILKLGGFAPVYAPAIMHAMWEKFVLLAAYSGMTCLMRASVGEILAAEAGKQIMVEALAECTQIAIAAGFAPNAKFLDEARQSLTERGSSNTSSMLREVRIGARTEHEHVLGDMLVRARASGIVMPLIRLAHAHMQAYQASRGLEQ